LLSGEDEDCDLADTASDTSGISMYTGGTVATDDTSETAPSGVPPWLPQHGAEGSKPVADDPKKFDVYMYPSSDSEVASKGC
jgi:hypothetical protein